MMLFGLLALGFALQVPAQADMEMRKPSIEQQLFRRAYQCTTFADGLGLDWNFDLTFGTRHYSHGRRMFVAEFSGKVTGSDDSLTQIRDWQQAKVGRLDDATQKLDIVLQDFITPIFHHGKPRRFRGSFSMEGSLDSLEGELTYKVGKRGEKRWITRKIQCALISKK